MKLSLLALTAAQFGSCVNASPSCHDKRSVEEVGEGYWEEDAPPSLYARANPKGKKFKLEQIQNNEYHGLGVPMEMARAFGKYHRTPPAAVQQAVEAMQAPTPKIKAANSQSRS